MDPATRLNLAIEYLAVLLSDNNYTFPIDEEVERIKKYIEEEIGIPGREPLRPMA